MRWMLFQVYSIVVIVPSVLPSSAVLVLKPLGLSNSFGNYVIYVPRLLIHRNALFCDFNIVKLSTGIRPFCPDT